MPNINNGAKRNKLGLLLDDDAGSSAGISDSGGSPQSGSSGVVDFARRQVAVNTTEPGSARRKKQKEPKAIITVRISANVKRRMEELQEEMDRNLSWLVNAGLDHWLKTVHKK